MRPPDAPQRHDHSGLTANAAVFALVGVTAVLIWLLIEAAAPVIHSGPIVTPSAPKTLVVMPSPDARLDAAMVAIATNTAALPTLTAAYAIEQTQTTGDREATWAAARQAVVH